MKSYYYYYYYYTLGAGHTEWKLIIIFISVEGALPEITIKLNAESCALCTVDNLLVRQMR